MAFPAPKLGPRFLGLRGVDNAGVPNVTVRTAEGARPVVAVAAGGEATRRAIRRSGLPEEAIGLNSTRL